MASVTKAKSATKAKSVSRAKPRAAKAPRTSSKKPSAKSNTKRKKKGDGDQVAFARWIHHPKTGVRLVAADYGYKAFPLR